MAGKRPRFKRNPGASAAVKVLVRDSLNPSGWKPVGKLHLLEALRKIARREWTAVWFDDGELAGVHLVPPGPRREVLAIPCGSAECLKWWVESASVRIVPKAEPARIPQSSLRQVFIDFFELEMLETPVRKVSAQLALRKIALGEWKAIWTTDGAMAGVAES